MKKILSAFVVLAFLCMPVFSAVIYQSGGKYGLKDGSGNIVLKAQYQTIEQLSYTPSKKVIIPMHAMDEVESKKLDMYKIKQNNLFGVANTHGKIVYECKYKNVEADSNGDLKLILSDGTVEYAHPVMNAAKAARDTLVTVVGLPVTLIGAVMLPIEAVSKVGKGK
ncbi:MAG: WG repeat-containing protein [Cyanobacteria bacterium RUI128]|nr:WG repeat-containing protein [Cyanobacteria bacterium RUI128]